MRPVIALFLLVATAAVSRAQTRAPGNDTILEDELRADLFFLASDEMRGRLTDTPENALAASFIRSRFERLGLKPMGPEGSYYQPFRLIRPALGEGNRLAILGRGATYRASLQGEFHPASFSPTASAEGDVVFAGYGIAAPKLGHDDYRSGADVRGKIVLVLDHEPGENDENSPFDGVVTSEYSRDIRKTIYAQSEGAVGVLFVSDVHNHETESNFGQLSARVWPEPESRIPRYTLASWAEAVRIPVAVVSPALVGAMIDEPFSALTRRAEAPGGVTAEALPWRVELATSVERTLVSDRNVVAAIEGSDPVLKDEWVIVGAHYDHDGADGDRVFNGADDDGSGTVGLLEIAEAYAIAARNGARPRRSVLFASWNSEERGLLGAWAYAEAPLTPLGSIVATLNMDMIGRNEEVPVGGGRRFRGLELQTAESNRNAVNIMAYSYSADLKRGVEEANRETELELKMRYDNNPSNLLRRSDQWPFLQKGIPSLFFHTGLHPDYHTEFDVPERIHYQKLTRIARLVHQLSWELAQADGRPAFDLPERAAAVP